MASGKGLELTGAVLSSLDAAYLNGKGKVEKPALSDERMVSAIGTIGLTEDDGAALQNFADLKKMCAVGLKLYRGINKLPEELRGPFARTFMTAE